MLKTCKLLCYATLIIMSVSFVHGSPTVQTKELSRWKWEVWDDLPGENFLRIHLFNLTNPDEFENGEVPILKEIGPYVFREKRDKVSITHLDSTSTASFKQVLTYEFVQSESRGSQDDLITTINIPFVSFGKKLSEITYIGPTHFRTLVKAKETLVRRNEKVGDFLYYGVDAKPYLNVLDNLSPGDIPAQFSEGRFGLFKGRNGTDEGEFLVETGETPESSYGKIIKWKEQSKLDTWGDEEYCNMINGTDGSVFDPKNMEKYDVRVFFPDACRSLDYTYDGEEMVNDILGLKYKFRKDMLEDPRKNADNLCFCVDPGEELQNCLKKGVMDISPCRDGAPIALSYPHFLDADEYYSQQVKGLDPKVEIHESYMIIEPKTGTVLEDRKRFQLNMRLKPIPGFAGLKTVKNMLYPVMWSDKTYTLDAATVAELKEELKKHPNDGPSWHSNKPANVGTAGEPEPKTDSTAQTSASVSTSLLLTISIVLITNLFILC